MIIERARACDAEEILSLQKLAYKSEAEIYNYFDIPPRVQTLKDMEGDFRRQIFLKATIDGKIIGSVRAFAEEGTCYIGKLMVHPDFQNQGTGKKLMNEIESRFKSCGRFELFTGNTSEKNIYLYQKIGYIIFKTEKINDNLTFVYLEKTISEPK